MEVFYVGRTHRTKAFGEYIRESGELVVHKGSIVSEEVVEFKTAPAVKKLREQYVDAQGILTQDIRFVSPSAAAAFVTGYSANGLTAWHVEKHKTLKAELHSK